MSRRKTPPSTRPVKYGDRLLQVPPWHCQDGAAETGRDAETGKAAAPLTLPQSRGRAGAVLSSPTFLRFSLPWCNAIYNTSHQVEITHLMLLK